MDSTTQSWPMRAVAYVMLFIATSVWPASWHMAYAQALPQGLVNTGADAPWTDESWTVSQLSDDATERAAINRRAARLLRGDGPEMPLRGPKLDTDSEPVRLPNLSVDPNDEANAKKQA